MIRVEGVHVDLGGTPVLEGVDLAVAPGRLVGLVGPNGAGKTTLLRAINGLLTPAAGRVVVDDEPVAGLSARQLGRRVATVPQHTTLAFDFSVREVVALGRHPHRPRFGGRDPDPGAVDRALRRTATDHLANRPVTDVSGGERQRVLLARALAQAAPVLLLDEPTASLDVHHQVRTLALVRDLVAGSGESGPARDGDGSPAGDGATHAPGAAASNGASAGVEEPVQTVLAAIHDLDLAARFCDELVLLTEGRVRTAGEPAAVLTRDHLEAAFGGRVAVDEDPATGTPSVTVLEADRLPRSVDAPASLD